MNEIERPLHIAALDSALMSGFTELDLARQDLAEFYVKHIELIDAEEAAKKRVQAAHIEVNGTCRAIETLGYGLQPHCQELLDERPRFDYSFRELKDAAREGDE